MNQPINSTLLPFPTAANAAGDHADASGRGRPSGYAPKVIDMLCDSIRRLGLSDSAAAEQQGMSTSTLSRWKKLYPEIRLKLQQARQEIRTFHLQRIFEQAAAENGKGWRASVWILERLFPGDYSPRVQDRLSYLNLEDCLRSKEESQALDEQLRELHEMQAEERAARAAQAAQAAGPVVATGLRAAPASSGGERGGESRNVEDGDARTALGAAASTGTGETEIYSEGGSHNSRNSGEGVPDGALHPQQAAATTKRQQAAAVQGGCAAGEVAAPFEGGSHNSRNSGESGA